jgi:negative regulator of replication initiation
VTGALPDSGSEYARAMKTIELTDEELRLLIAAVHSYLDDFGHEEADVLRRAKQLLAKLQSSAE